MPWLVIQHQVHKGALLILFMCTGGAAPPATDPYWANVSLLIDEASAVDGATSFPDLSTNTKTITANGNIQWDTAVTINGKPTILTDGTTDFLSIATHADFGFGTGDFTIELCLRRYANPGSDEQIMDLRTSGSTNGMFYLNPGDNMGYYNGSSVGGTAGNPGTGTARFHSWSRVSGTLYAHMDGVHQWNAAMAGDFTGTRAVRIFANFAGTANISCNANMIRVTKGVGRYNGSNYTPPTSYPHS